MIWFHNWRLRSNYRGWQRLRNGINNGAKFGNDAREQLLGYAYRCEKHANALRRLGEYVPPVPNEKGFPLL